MLYLVEVFDSIRFLEKQHEEVAKKVDVVDAVSHRLDELSIQELLTRVDTLEPQIVRTGNVTYGRGDSSSGSTVHMEERVIEIDNSQKNMLEMINDMMKDFFVTLDVVRKKITEVNMKVNLMMLALAN